MILSVKGVGKAFRDYRSEWHRFARWFGFPIQPANEAWVLKNIDINIFAGESIGIVGSNGAGKSTLLKIITRTLQPTEGTVQVNGRVSAILELGMGFNPDLTGRQNVRHAAGLMGFSLEEIESKMPDIEGFSEIGDSFDDPVRTYSSGMQMRVAFAVATAWRPDILIVDEALSVGDAYFQAKCFKHINQFKKDGTTLLLVSHSAEDIVKHCTRAILLRDGQIVSDGASRDVTNIYLDELFGKKYTSDVTKSISKTSLVKKIFKGNVEGFHTRPSYHKDEHRWGHGGAVILDYLVLADEKEYPTNIEGDKTTDFFFNVRFDAEFNNIVPGFLIKTLEGIFVYGTNSFLSTRGKIRISAHAGDVKTFKFSLPLSLKEGFYLASFGVSEGDPQGELTALDRRYDSVLVNITRKNQFSGLVNLEASFQQISSQAEYS